MIFLLSGLIIGLVMGLTGAGGALVALPLFIHLAGIPLQEASVLSLLAVFIAAFLNFIPVRKMADGKTSLLIFPFSLFAGAITVPLKNVLPEPAMKGIILFIAFFALYSVWQPIRVASSGPRLKKIFSIPVTGLVVGALTTLTGLGGGVVLVPLLRYFFQIPMNRAIATSLVLVAASSVFSFLFQMNRLPLHPEILFLIPGILISVFAQKILIRKESEMFRKIIFTVVAVVTVFGLIF